MGLYKNWVCFVRTKLSKSQTAHRRIVDKSSNDNRSADEGEDNEDCHELIAATNVNDDDDDDDDDDINASPSWIEKEYSAEDIAAIKIQAFYRGVLARRAFRALRSIVKLQALVRGVQVRRQSRIALHCMHALVRLQVSVRTRQLLRN